MKYTKNYRLPQWVESDRIMMNDFNSAMTNIESGIDGAKAEAQSGDSALSSRMDTIETKADSAQSTANAARTEASRKPYATGSYTGTGKAQSIYLGFRPRFLLIAGMEHHVGNRPETFTNYTAITGGHATSDEVKIIDTGFTITEAVGWAPMLNLEGRVYDYIAFQ